MSLATEKPIFIVACPRSGTTILGTILNHHPEITTSTETHFFNYVAKEKKYDWKNFNASHFELFIDESRVVDFCTLAKVTKDELRERFSKLELGVVAGVNKRLIFNLIIEALTEKKGKKYFCEKTPQHLQNLEEIVELYPQAKFIHLIRDGRDTVNSLLKMPWRPGGLINNSRFWKSYIKLGNKLEKELPRANFLTIHYEKLLKEPEATLEKVCKFIGVEYDPAMLTSKGNTDPSNIFSDWESSWKHKSLEEIDSTRIGAWEKELSIEEKLILNWHQKKTLETLGYKPLDHQLKLEVRLRVLGEYLQLFMKKFFRLVSFVVN